MVGGGGGAVFASHDMVCALSPLYGNRIDFHTKYCFFLFFFVFLHKILLSSKQKCLPQNMLSAISGDDDNLIKWT